MTPTTSSCLNEGMSGGNAEIEQFCILARSQGNKSRACAALIQQVLSHKKLYVFGELLDIPSVQSLENSDYNQAYKSLELFAYGVYKDYIEHQELYLELSDFQIFKLRQLTIVTLAEKSTILPYCELFDALQIPPQNTRELEDLIIETIYTGLLSARLNQQSRILRIFDFFSRDVRPEVLPSIIDTFVQWKAHNSLISAHLQESSKHMKEQRDYGVAQRQEAQALAEAEKQNLKTSLEAGFDLQDIAKMDSVSSLLRGFQSHSVPGRSPRSKTIGNSALFYGLMGKI